MYKFAKNFSYLSIIIAIFISIQGCSSHKVTVAADVYKTDTPSVTNTPVTSPTSTTTPKLVEYNGVIPHIFFHCLIAFPEIAYSAVNKGVLDTDCVTISEYKRCLDELYNNNYFLVDINSTFETIKTDGQAPKVIEKKALVPEGKIPIIISFDDMVYDPKKLGTGMVDKIILDDKGEFATYTKHSNGEVVISHDN